VIKALMVDVDGVLINGRPSDGQHWGADLENDFGVPFAVLQSEFFAPYWEQVVTGNADLRECLTGALAKIKPKVSVDRLLQYWFQGDARINDQLLRDIAVHRSAGLRIYLATNQEHERARYLMDNLGLSAHVHGIYYSAALGVRKPRLEFFHRIAEMTGLKPEELLLIDDTGENVEAASAAGWHAARWTPNMTLDALIMGLPIVPNKHLPVA